MKKILLSRQGKNKGKYFAIVDDVDFDYLNQWKWCFHSNYAAGRKQGKYTAMHTLIMNTPRGREVDHINGNGLDNRQENLRIVNRGQNRMNCKKSKNNNSGYKGVGWFEKAKKWRAQIQFNKKRIHLGVFNNPMKAAKFYDKKAKELFGEYAKLNFS